MLGAVAVGKTSLVSRFVRSIFSEKYLSTVGVKIDKKAIRVGERDVVLILWDIEGEREFQRIQESYLRGSAGYILVADGTRSETLAVARALRERVERLQGAIPFVLAVNKADLESEGQISAADIEALTAEGWQVLRTSAKTGLGVETLFEVLGRSLVGPSG